MYLHLCLCILQYCFYATVLLIVHQHNTKILPSFPPVNFRIVAQGFQKGPPQERSMWDESDSYALKNMQAHTPRKEKCVGSEQQYVITNKQNIFGQ